MSSSRRKNEALFDPRQLWRLPAAFVLAWCLRVQADAAAAASINDYLGGSQRAALKVKAGGEETVSCAVLHESIPGITVEDLGCGTYRINFGSEPKTGVFRLSIWLPAGTTDFTLDGEVKPNDSVLLETETQVRGWMEPFILEEMKLQTL